MIQSISLDSSRPCFVATHSRVTTTLRFPGAIGAPEGRGFTEDESKTAGEYLVSWVEGESHVSVTPLPGAGSLNLNIPYQGATYVFYFYPVEKQFQAVASLNLVTGAPGPAASSGADSSLKSSGPGAGGKGLVVVPPSPARLLGLVDRLKLVRALPPGPGLEALVHSFGLELMNAYTVQGAAEWRECGALSILITQVARDPRLGCLGFALRLKNRGVRALAPDVASFSVRCGGVLLGATLGDAPPILTPGEECEAFLAAVCPPGLPLAVGNDWTVSVGVLP